MIGISPRLIAALLVLALTGIMLGGWWLTSRQLTATKAELAAAHAQVSVLQTDLDALTQAITAAEREKEQLRRDAALIASALTERETARLDAGVRLASSTAAVRSTIEATTDAQTKAWAAAAVPAELNRLLQHAAACADRDRDQDSHCTAAGGAAE